MNTEPHPPPAAEFLLEWIREHYQPAEPFCLTDDELVRLTGYHYPTKQAEFVRNTFHIPASVNGANECVVVRAHLLAAATPVNGKPRPQVLQVRKLRPGKTT